MAAASTWNNMKHKKEVLIGGPRKAAYPNWGQEEGIWFWLCMNGNEGTMRLEGCVHEGEEAGLRILGSVMILIDYKSWK